MSKFNKSNWFCKSQIHTQKEEKKKEKQGWREKCTNEIQWKEQTFLYRDDDKNYEVFIRCMRESDEFVSTTQIEKKKCLLKSLNRIGIKEFSHEKMRFHSIAIYNFGLAVTIHTDSISSVCVRFRIAIVSVSVKVN